MSVPTVTVVVPTWQAAHDVVDCLDALDRQTYRDFEVLVVDGGSPDGTADIARANRARVLMDDGRSRAEACESALRVVDTPYVAFTDADCVPDPNWLENLVSRLEAATPDWASVGGPNVAPDDDTEWGKAVDVVFGTRLMSGGTRYGFESGEDVEINHNPGCNVLYRTDFLRAVGFEPFPTAEDVVLDHKIRIMGGRLLYTPTAVVRHKRRASLRSFFRQMRRYGEGRALAARKYNRLWQSVYPLPSVGIILAGLLLAAGVVEAVTLGGARVLGVLLALGAAYVGLVALDVARSESRFLTPRRGLLALLLIPVGQVAWGIGYLKGSFARHPAFVSRKQGLARDVAFMALAAAAGLAAFLAIA